MLKNGDVIFLNYKSKDIQSEISKLEKGYQDIRFNHVGMYHDGKIIEATPEGVIYSELDKFFDGSDEKVLVARHKLSVDAAEHALTLVGRPYNKTFIRTDKTFYCSELIHYAFELANTKPVFKTHKLLFNDDKEDVSEFWVKYYLDLKIDVPVNEMGSNPSNLSLSTKFDKKIIVKSKQLLNEK